MVIVESFFGAQIVPRLFRASLFHPNFDNIGTLVATWKKFPKMELQFRAHQFSRRLQPVFEPPTFVKRKSHGVRVPSRKSILSLDGVQHQTTRFEIYAALSNDMSVQDRQRAFRLAPIQASL